MNQVLAESKITQNNLTTKKKKVLLYNFGPKSDIVYFPIQVLMVAHELEKNNYEPIVVDTRVQDYKNYSLKDVICVGISTRSGPEILDGLEVAQYVRDTDPKIPIVWGGNHPSLLYAQTAKDPLVDVVVKGEGDETVLELVQRFDSNQPIEDVKGIVFEKNGKVIVNPDREFFNMDTQGNLPYRLLDMKKYYIDKFFSYQSSRGCPHDCTFCYNHAFNKRRYRIKSPETVLHELEYIKKNFNPETITFVDDNFFTSKFRAIKIAQGMIDGGLNLKWKASCRADYLRRYEPEVLDLFKKSGCTSLSIGAESGSQYILKQIRKDITLEDIKESCIKCVNAKIDPIYSFMCGFPEEKTEDLNLTLDCVDYIYEHGGYVNGIFCLISYPGTPLFNQAVNRGLKIPSSLKGWGDWGWNTRETIPPWISKRHHKKLMVIGEVCRYFSLRKTLENISKRPDKFSLKFPLLVLWKMADTLVLYPSARIRWKKRYFKYAYEWGFWQFIKNLYLGHH
jgi:radical SAM superfamily enzyme YgiQ (UPF0313 family)|tara:strand:+ start:2866 stop:4386 length:1521 start_codon:yes stop_codon:yes gene_type:complete